MDGERTVTELAEQGRREAEFDLAPSEPASSSPALVSARRDEKFIYYSLGKTGSRERLVAMLYQRVL